jgi:hypothetical protein
MKRISLALFVFLFSSCEPGAPLLEDPDLGEYEGQNSDLEAMVGGGKIEKIQSSHKKNYSETVRCWTYRKTTVPYFRFRVSKGTPDKFNKVSSCSEYCFDTEIQLNEYGNFNSTRFQDPMGQSLSINVKYRGVAYTSKLFNEPTQCSLKANVNNGTIEATCENMVGNGKHFSFRTKLRCRVEEP